MSPTTTRMQKAMKLTGLAILLLAGPLGCVAPHTDGHGCTLPHDTRHLHVVTETGTVSFTRPNGWRIVQLPRPDNLTYVLGFVGLLDGDFTYGHQPHIDFCWINSQTTARISQRALHAKFLREWRTHLGEEDDMRGYEAGSYQLGTAHTASHRAIDIYFYAGAPFLNLWALIPERGGVSQLCLQTTEPGDIARYYDTFTRVLESYDFR